MSDKQKVIIVGAGITGLATAYWLKQSGYAVTVLEKGSEPGGSMESIKEEGFLFDRGPNSGLETTPLIGRLVRELGLEDKFVYANQAGNKRYILRGGKLHPLATSPGAFIKSTLFSGAAKRRLMLEPFIGRSKDGYRQSIAEFVSRRFGQEFLDYAINPFVSGVYAGDPTKLSVKSAFPKLYALEEEYGSVLLGAVRSIRKRKKSKSKSKQAAKMFSFTEGMQALPRALAEHLGSIVLYHADTQEVAPAENGYTVTYTDPLGIRTVQADYVITTTPSYVTSNIIRNLDQSLVEKLNSIYYPPVLVLYAGYDKRMIEQPLDGFGFLIPQKENRAFLGAIWSSNLFQNRVPTDLVAGFTLFVGGARNPGLPEQNEDELVKQVLKEFEEIMGIKEEPFFLRKRMWHKAIPQYNVGYRDTELAAEEFEKKYPGLFLRGNYRGGISVGDCVRSSGVIADAIIGTTTYNEA